MIRESDLIEIIIYSCLSFMLMGILLVSFFYFSRKKIIEKELEKNNLELKHQKNLLRAEIITQEEERKRIAQDLHDDISSKLNIVSLNSHLLSTPDLTPSEIATITENIIALTGKALDSSRKIAHGLLPPVLDKFGLHAGIEEMCQEFNSSKAVKIKYINTVEFDILDCNRHLHVFRILQELITNSIRHGKACSINIFFEKKEEQVYCNYSDNGIGLDLTRRENQKGLGMKNIESRVAFLNGILQIDSVFNKGITVVFNF
jgi:signal transduction histidine kinase